MEFRILGPVQVMHAGSELPLGGPRHRKLLAALLLHADEVVPVGRLVDALWGESPPRSARDMLHVRVSELRTALRAGRPEGADAPPACSRETAVTCCGRRRRPRRPHVRAARRRRVPGARRRRLRARARAGLADALALWHGPALAEFADEPFARAAVDPARGPADAGGGEPADRRARPGPARRPGRRTRDPDGVVPAARAVLVQLMLALYRAGRQSEALAAYRAARDVLAEQLGVEPGTDLRRAARGGAAAGSGSLDLAADASRPGPSGRRSPPRRVGNVPAGLTSVRRAAARPGRGRPAHPGRPPGDAHRCRRRRQEPARGRGRHGGPGRLPGRHLAGRPRRADPARPRRLGRRGDARRAGARPPAARRRARRPPRDGHAPW